VGWKCLDVQSDPYELEKHDLAECGDLVKLADAAYGRLPGQGVAKH
jgi:hypothetical protein